MVEVLQFKATVWPKVASESTYETQKFKNFLGDDAPSCFCIYTASGLKLGGAWVRRKHSVPKLCPGIGCVLATPLLGVVVLHMQIVGKTICLSLV